MHTERFPDERNTGTSPLRKVQLIQLRILKIVDYICTTQNIKYWLDGGTLLGAVRHQGFIPWDDDIDIVMPRSDYRKFILAIADSLPPDLQIETYADSKNKDYYVPCKIIDKYSKIMETSDNSKDIGRGVFIDITPLDYFHTSFPLKQFDLFLKKAHRALIKISNPNSRNKFKFHFAIHKILTSLSPVMTADTPVLFFRNLIEWKIGKEDRCSSIIGYGFDSNWIRLFNTSDIFPLKVLRFEDGEFPTPANHNEILKIFYGTAYMTPPRLELRHTMHIKKAIIDTRIGMEVEDIVYSAHTEIQTC